MQPDQDRLRADFKEAHNRFHGRFDTHAEIARHARWTEDELEGVQIEDEELYYDELQALIAREVRLGRLDEVNRWFRLRVNGGDLELRTAGTITRIALNNRDTEAVRMRIAQLKQEVKNNG